MTSTLARTFVLREPAHAASLLAFVKANAAAMAARGEPLEVRVSVHRAKRSLDQNALHWAILQTIADQAWIAGRRFDSEVWNEHMKRELLPDETARGVKKWRYLPSGDRMLAMSTSDLDRSEMSTYLDRLQAAAATDLGVSFDATNHRDQ